MKQNLKRALSALLLALLLGGCASAPAPAATEAPVSAETAAPLETPAVRATSAPNEAPAETPGPTAAPEPAEAPDPHEDDSVPVFPESGYTTGDRELDLWLLDIIDSQREEGQSLEELRQRVYLYVRDSFGYRKSKIYFVNDGDFSASAIGNMKRNLNGNCYNFASMQYGLFRALGFEAYLLVGRIADDQPHCWVALVEDGVKYYCDAEMEMQSIRMHKQWRNFYMELPEDLAYLNYYEQYSVPELPTLPDAGDA